MRGVVVGIVYLNLKATVTAADVPCRPQREYLQRHTAIHQRSVVAQGCTRAYAEPICGANICYFLPQDTAIVLTSKCVFVQFPRAAEVVDHNVGAVELSCCRVNCGGRLLFSRTRSTARSHFCSRVMTMTHILLCLSGRYVRCVLITTW